MEDTFQGSKFVKLSATDLMKFSTAILVTAFLIFGLMTTNAQECGYVYVSTTGATSGVAGTRDMPADLTYGLQLADATNNHLRIAHGQ